VPLEDELDELLLEDELDDELLDDELLDELVMVESPLELLVELVDDSPLVEPLLPEVLDEPLDDPLAPPLLDDAELAAGMPLGNSMPQAATSSPTPQPPMTTIDARRARNFIASLYALWSLSAKSYSVHVTGNSTCNNIDVQSVVDNPMRQRKSIRYGARSRALRASSLRSVAPSCKQTSGTSTSEIRFANESRSLSSAQPLVRPSAEESPRRRAQARDCAP
jgi:hypothetical protein